MIGMLDAEISKAFDLYAVARGCLAPGIHDGFLSDFSWEESIDGADVVGHVVMERGAGLYLAQGEFAIRLRDEIDFHAMACSHEVDVVHVATVEPALDGFHHDHVLEEASHERMGGDLIGGLDSEKVAGEAGFREIYLWRLDEALPEIPVVWAERSYYVGRFKNRKPFLHCRHRNARITGKRVDVEKLRYASGNDT